MWAAIQSNLFSVSKLVKNDVKLSIFTRIQFCSAYVFLFLCLISTIDHIGKSQIECMGDGGESQATVTTYCYISGLFILVNNEEKVEITYYMWVPLVMLLCTLHVYIAKFIFKHLLWGDSLPSFLNGLKKTMETESVATGFQLKARIQLESKKWMFSEITLEFINFITPFIQIYCIDNLLQGKFLFLGLKINNDAYLNNLFPRRAKCNFLKTGPSGTQVNTDYLCVLPNNQVNEKIFIFASIWLMFSASISIFGLIWRISTVVFYKACVFNKFVWICNGVSGSKQKEFLAKLNIFSEWLYIYDAASNLDHVELSYLLDQLSNTFINVEEMREIMCGRAVKTRRNHEHLHNSEDGVENNDDNLDPSVEMINEQQYSDPVNKPLL